MLCIGILQFTNKKLCRHLVEQCIVGGGGWVCIKTGNKVLQKTTKTPKNRASLLGLRFVFKCSPGCFGGRIYSDSLTDLLNDLTLLDFAYLWLTGCGKMSRRMLGRSLVTVDVVDHYLSRRRGGVAGEVFSPGPRGSGGSWRGRRTGVSPHRSMKSIWEMVDEKRVDDSCDFANVVASAVAYKLIPVGSNLQISSDCRAFVEQFLRANCQLGKWDCQLQRKRAIWILKFRSDQIFFLVWISIDFHLKFEVWGLNLSQSSFVWLCLAFFSNQKITVIKFRQNYRGMKCCQMIDRD